ncbi:MAG: class I SAM-dependent methyltransferase [Calditrichaeota bacterium]|nr:MAG: class I SAM-dependent methyltransferase [Calditrichota bacterium]
MRTHEAVIRYFEKSKWVYDIFLGGAKHLGLHPGGRRIAERRALNLLHDLIAEKLSLSPGMRVLDAGCGEGVVASYLSNKYGCEIHGVTVVPFEIGRARKRAAKNRVVEKVHFHLMDYNHLAFPNGFFDAVYSVESLVHSASLENTFQELYRVLKKTGRVAFFEYGLEDKHCFSARQRQVLQQMEAATGMYSLESFRNGPVQKSLQAAGFTHIEIEELTPRVAPSVLRLKRYFYLPYRIVKCLGVESRFPNLTSVVEFANMGQQGLFKYQIYTAKK